VVLLEGCNELAMGLEELGVIENKEDVIRE
jgi:hypothetical protein